ncbi:hypothetical protein ERJ75_000749000 [Trypanosoma vivax]|uniref:Uncharacterized protein n=1 Tax=Trypanosoma vivax (strain Y486) TaxID=1055687 RepID=G0U083_TRYVY|nr:hypothetical protein ERJ75_000749000 [Trypanosoma vivax]CCC49481.1 conserved hypothetical protein [Trypanosoma vivax Y486]
MNDFSGVAVACMHLSERHVEGLACGVLLAPHGWALRVHHDISGASSLNVAHFESLDRLGDSLYVAESFLPRRAVPVRECGSATPSGQLAALLAEEMQTGNVLIGSTWEVECELTSKASSRCSYPCQLAVVLRGYTLLVSVFLCTSAGSSRQLRESFAEIVAHLKDRYNCILNQERENSGEPLNSSVSALYTRRGNSVIEIDTSSVFRVKWKPPHNESSRLLYDVAADLGLVSEDLHVALLTPIAAVEIIAVLLPLKPGVCLMHHCSIKNVWNQRIQTSSWFSVQTKSINGLTCLCETTEPGVSHRPPPCSAFYRLSRKGGKTGNVLAWVTEPRLGSDSCVVLLATVSEEQDGGSHAESELHDDLCVWLQCNVRIGVSTVASWSALCMAENAGFLFRQANLVMQLSSVSAVHANTCITPTASLASGMEFSATCGSITILAGVDGAVQRQATVALLNEYRCAEDYVDFIVTEFTYDTPPGHDPAAVWRRTKKLLPSGEGAECTLWIRLGNNGVVCYLVRECGLGRLLLVQACLLDGQELVGNVAEQWESWLIGVGFAAVA